MAAHPGSDLTGVWDGVFGYPRNYPSTPFTAVLLDLGSNLTGSVHEVPTLGAAKGKTLTALISGSRTASTIRFTKTYERQEGGHRQVEYDGEITAEATRIEGRWTIPGVWSGPFVMTRPRPVFEAIEEARTVEEEVDV